MTKRVPPQPAVDRMIDFAGHPMVVGVTPGQSDLVPLTAISLARAMRTPMLHFAFADTTRYTLAEHDDGTVDHAPIEVDSADDAWLGTRDQLHDQLAALLADSQLQWRFVYLAGRPDRALTHLARAVDASVIVVGTRHPGSGARMREFVEGSVAAHLVHHQHRPVLTVPLSVVDWKDIEAPWQ